jgi:DNA-directed RNA polymerase subunit beta'
MGHIDLAAPVAHIWFSKGTPSRLGLLLDLSPRNLDRVLYFAQYLITDVDVELKGQLLEQLHADLEERNLEKESRIESAENTLTEEYQSQIEPLQSLLPEEITESGVDDEKSSDEQLETEGKIESLQKERDQKIEELLAEINDEYAELLSAIEKEVSSLKELHVTKLLTETQYRETISIVPALSFC